MSETKYSHTHIVKQNDVETNRYDVRKRKTQIPISDPVVEAGDLTSEMMKSYQTSLWDAIDEHRKLNFPNLYFAVYIKRNPFDKNEFRLKIMPFKQPLEKLHENMDFYKYDYQKDELLWLWSVPHKYMMKNYLRNEKDIDPKLIRCIKQFLKQENMDLNDFKPSKIIKLN